MLDRWDMAADALEAVGFTATANGIRGGRFYPRQTLHMMRWAVAHYVAERPQMARALKLVKALARQVRHA